MRRTEGAFQERALFSNCDVIATSHRLSSIEGGEERRGEERRTPLHRSLKSVPCIATSNIFASPNTPARPDAPPCACACIVHRLIQSHPSVIRHVPVRRTDSVRSVASFPIHFPIIRNAEFGLLDGRERGERGRSFGFHVFCNAHVSDCHSWRS